MQEIRDMEREAEWKQRAVETELRGSDKNLKKAIVRRVAAGNAEAVEALKRLVNWHPVCGFPSNIRPAYFESRSGPNGHQTVKAYKKDAMLNEAPFCSEAYTYEVWGKEDARTFLAYPGQIARALGLDGLHDSRLR